MRLELTLAILVALGTGCAVPAAAQSDPLIVLGPRHARGAQVTQDLSFTCNGIPITARWTPGVAEVRLKVGDRSVIHGEDVAFVRDLFAPRIRPIAFWSRCFDKDFHIGVDVVTPGSASPNHGYAVVWFTYDGRLAGYTGLEAESPARFNQRLD